MGRPSKSLMIDQNIYIDFSNQHRDIHVHEYCRGAGEILPYVKHVSLLSIGDANLRTNH